MTEGGAGLNFEVVEGVFIKELKNRFLCEVKIENQVEVCYVSSSCHLSNFLDLRGKRVLLTSIVGKKARTRYSVFAVAHKRSYIILNPSLANKVVSKSIHTKRFSFLGKRNIIESEYTIDNYKSDIFIPKSKTVIEIKSLISLDSVAIFPTVYSERMERQLKELISLSGKGFDSYIFIVSLNPYVKKICLNSSNKSYDYLCSCLKAGVKIRAFSLIFKDNKLKVKRELPVMYESV